MPLDSVCYALQDTVAVVQLDDGKANAFSPGTIEALQQGLDRAEKEAEAALLVGRPRCFSGGFDLTIMRSEPEAVRALVRAGAELFLRIHEYPLPVLIACTGHAVAAGAVALLAADARIGAGGDYKIGLNEVAIGMPLPIFALELARQRLSKRHFARATTQAKFYTPEEAVDAGFLDRVTDPEQVLDTSLAEAARLGRLPQPAFRLTKARANGAAIALIRETLEEDLSRLTGLSRT